MHLTVDLGHLGCHICGKSFEDQTTFAKHLHAYHPEQWRRFAGFSEGSSSAAGERIFKCHICSKKYVHKTALVRHMSMHPGEAGNATAELWTCEFCGKIFTRESYLLRHKQMMWDDAHKEANVTNKILPLRSRMNPSNYPVVPPGGDSSRDIEVVVVDDEEDDGDKNNRMSGLSSPASHTSSVPKSEVHTAGGEIAKAAVSSSGGLLMETEHHSSGPPATEGQSSGSLSPLISSSSAAATSQAQCSPRHLQPGQLSWPSVSLSNNNNNSQSAITREIGRVFMQAASMRPLLDVPKNTIGGQQFNMSATEPKPERNDSNFYMGRSHFPNERPKSSIERYSDSSRSSLGRGQGSAEGSQQGLVVERSSSYDGSSESSMKSVMSPMDISLSSSADRQQSSLTGSRSADSRSHASLSRSFSLEERSGPFYERSRSSHETLGSPMPTVQFPTDLSYHSPSERSQVSMERSCPSVERSRPLMERSHSSEEYLATTSRMWPQMMAERAILARLARSSLDNENLSQEEDRKDASQNTFERSRLFLERSLVHLERERLKQFLTNEEKSIEKVNLRERNSPTTSSLPAGDPLPDIIPFPAHSSYPFQHGGHHNLPSSPLHLQQKESSTRHTLSRQESPVAMRQEQEACHFLPPGGSTWLDNLGN